MRKIMTIIGLEAYVILLAWMQSTGGVRTDEAKYLLNIPYPHPPLMRWVMHLTEGFMYQEMLWRVLLATLLVQAVWIVAKMSNSWVLPALYLISASVILQAGSIMMAPITAVQGLVFVWLLRESRITNHESRIGWISLFWLTSLFTAYQAILYAPIVAMIFWWMDETFMKKVIGFTVPIGLVCLYTLTNPLSMASFVNAGGQNTVLDLVVILTQIGNAWLLSGSVVLSIVGTVGMLRERSVPLILSTLLVIAFLFVSYRSYYPILFLPLFIGGAALGSDMMKKSLVVAQVLAMIFLLYDTTFVHRPSEARMHMQQMDSSKGYIELEGSFGHEWQYESTVPVLRSHTP